MGKKIAFLGAGSFGFTRELVKDLLTFPALSDSTICLMDIDEQRLELIAEVIRKIVRVGKYPAKVETTLKREEALQGADGVVSTVLCGAVDVWRHDIEIPKEYGVDINVGDTRGPAGIFRTLRTVPLMLDICKDIEKYCPNAVFLNYTNPMAMLCRAMQGEFPKLSITGLCHSVQGLVHELAKMLDMDGNEIDYVCAGINHQAHYLKFEKDGKDLYPLLREKILSSEEVYKREIVRNEMFLHLGYYVTESSGHNSEYNPWFRKNQELIDKYTKDGTGWNPGKYAYIRDEYLKRLDGGWTKEVQAHIDEPDDKLNLKRGHEYAANIFNAVFGDNEMFKFNGNVRNFGIIENLPYGCCVEVPVIASRNSLEAVHIGKLPAQLALLNSINAQCEEIAVEAAIEGDPEKVFYSVMFDPLTSAVLDLQQTKKMVKQMLEYNKPYLPQFKSIEF